MSHASWQPAPANRPSPWPVPTVGVGLKRGLACRCPACGRQRLFDGFLRVVSTCKSCGTPLGRFRADDAPPYFTILITGHIIVPLLVISQQLQNPPTWLLLAIFLPLTLIVALGLLRPIKGGTLGVMLAMGLTPADPGPE